MTSATEEKFAMDVRDAKARQFARQIAHTLAAYIPEVCFREAERHLYDVALKTGAEIVIDPALMKRVEDSSSPLDGHWPT